MYIFGLIVSIGYLPRKLVMSSMPFLPAVHMYILLLLLNISFIIFKHLPVRERTVKISKGTGEYPWGFRIQFSKPIVVTEVDTSK